MVWLKPIPVPRYSRKQWAAIAAEKAMGGKCKTRPGPRLPDYSLIVLHAVVGHWIYFHDRPLHPEWVLHCSPHTLKCAARGGARLALYAESDDAYTGTQKEEPCQKP